MRVFVLGILLLISLILQTTVFNFIQVAGVKPDLVLIFVIFYGLINGPKEGVIFGFVAGLVQDLFIGQYIGMYAFSKMLTGYIFGLMETRIFKENLFIPILALAAGTFFHEFIYYFLSFLMGVRVSFGPAFFRIMLPTAIYNSCLAPFIYGKFYTANKKGILSRSC